MISGKADCGLQYAVRKGGSAVGYCALSIKCGTRDERGFHSGIAHFTEHTIFKGTAKRSASVINGYLDRLGGELNAFTTKEEIVFHATVLKEDLIKALGTLTERERKVIELRFGLKDGVPMTLEQVGKKLGVTRERIRQIEAKAIRKLSRASSSKKLEGYID